LTNQCIQQAQERQQNFRRLRSIIKPTQSGGLSYIIVPKDFSPDQYPYDPDNVREWEQVHDANNLQEYIQQRNITHFGQAHGTPFTISPLAEQINWSATNKAAEELIHGMVPLELLSDNIYTNKVLEYIAKRDQLLTINTYMTREQVSTGLKKWREDTSTSPSGCHLGLRRIPAFSSPINEIEARRGRIQQIQADIINIPIGMGFSPSRWQTIVNAMLEKIAVKPLLHKLCVIHIVEADCNLALKEIFGRRLMFNCEQFGTLGDYQDGFRKGRSTTRTLLQNELFNDYNKRLRINNFVGMTDISGCFDRILPPIISLLNRKNGCPEEAVTCHAETLQNAKYFLKTEQGISTTSYSHSRETPVYGNGQGAGDSPSQWSQESAMLFDIYSSQIAGATMAMQNGESATSLTLAAFEDDTNLLGNDPSYTKSTEQMVEDTKTAFQTWDRLLHSTGHFMELGKCACYLSIWSFQEDGYAYTLSPNELNVTIEVQDIEGQTQIIPQLPTDKSQKLLGVMKNPIDNQQDEVR
jgi:hypothetical protein